MTTMTPEPVRRWWSVSALARAWRVPRRWIAHQIDKGALPAYRVGGRVLRIRDADCRAYGAVPPPNQGSLHSPAGPTRAQ